MTNLHTRRKTGAIPLITGLFKISLFPLLIAVFVLLSLQSCKKNIDTVKNSEILSLPSQTGIDVHTVLTDSGLVNLVLSTPIIETYSNADPPYSEFAKGLRVDFYDGKKEPIAYVISKYAKYFENKKLWELSDSVVVMNESGSKLETEQLFWDQERDRIYSDRMVRFTDTDKIHIGTGFESDSRLTTMVIKKYSSILYIDNE
jgi:LPS export ABC transporter protein LptC